MHQEEIRRIVTAQKNFFETRSTLPLAFRRAALVRLRSAILLHKDALADALRQDLGKSPSESYMCEIGPVLQEISYLLKNLEAFAAKRAVKTPLAQFPARSYVKPHPHGNVLVMSPWNYPVLLTLDPLAEALAAGNTVLLAPNAEAACTARVIKEMLDGIFPEKYVAVINGGREVHAQLPDMGFDYIFFTGSKAVGRLVMGKAAEHLTPVTLELGGKSPCVVDATANLRLAARKIVFGKFLNCGQTCVAPDYVLCEETVKDELIRHIKREILRQYGSDPIRNEHYGRIISQKHFDRLCGLICKEKVVHGGECDAELLKIAPTVMDGVTAEDAVMQEEIFGPILPIVTFGEIGQAVTFINQGERPLALYVFSASKERIAHVLDGTRFGGGCINDVVIHMISPYMSFGGVGESGMGAYHGKAGFDTFSHQKSILNQSGWLDMPVRYQPYTRFKDRLIRFLLQ